jgi:hypothetical protein
MTLDEANASEKMRELDRLIRSSKPVTAKERAIWVGWQLAQWEADEAARALEPKP